MVDTTLISLVKVTLSFRIKIDITNTRAGEDWYMAVLAEILQQKRH